jgi:serine/threonine-protein kinase
MALSSKLGLLFARCGAPARFAVAQVLHGVLPGCPTVADLMGRVLDCARETPQGQYELDEARLPALMAADRERVEQVLDVLAGDLQTLLAQVAALESLPAAVQKVMEAALATDPRCQAAAARLSDLAGRFDQAAARRPRDSDLAGLRDRSPWRGPPDDAEASSPPTRTWDRAALPRSVLEVIAGPHQGARFEFDRHDTFLVGRAPDANLQLLDDGHFSRHHFLLEFNPPHCYLRDLGSSNGTFVNGRQVTECFLKNGDVISGGKTRLRILLPDQGELPQVSQAGSTAQSLPALEPTRAGGLVTAAPVQFLPGYEIVRLLGQGGMGVVYLARRQATEQVCAIKLILPESAASERAMNLFLREVSVLSQLDHPSIVRFHEMGMARGQFFFAMDYVPTIDLRTRLAGVPESLRIGRVCGLTCQILEGLGYAHLRGFVHRDIKPSNILVSEAEAGLRAHLADFGLAKNYQNAGFSGITHQGQVLGTVAFMAPEQIFGGRAAKPNVDVYGVGATLFQLLAHRLPYDFRTRKDRLAVILEDEPLALTPLCPAAPAALGEVVRQALAKDPKDRFATADALRQALLPFAANR